MHREGIINLAAGPSALPQPVLEEAAKGLLNYEGTGMGITELSHRSPEFSKLTNDLEDILRKHLKIPLSHRVLFTQRAASLHFTSVLMNLLAPHPLFYPNLPQHHLVTH